jgi:hypothetical protein
MVLPLELGVSNLNFLITVMDNIPTTNGTRMRIADTEVPHARCIRNSLNSNYCGRCAVQLPYRLA